MVHANHDKDASCYVGNLALLAYLVASSKNYTEECAEDDVDGEGIERIERNRCEVVCKIGDREGEYREQTLERVTAIGRRERARKTIREAHARDDECKYADDDTSNQAPFCAFDHSGVIITQLDALWLCAV